MKENNLSNLVVVEHYFLNRMNDSILALGKKPAGWDEVVTAGLPAEHALVMWWRHDKPQMLQQALEKQYQVVLCPRIPLYFDFVQDASHRNGRKWQGAFAPLEAVYRFPTREMMGGADPDNPLIKGIQGNVWTETIHSPERLDFMLYPRLSALAEAAWSEDAVKEQGSFNERLKAMLARYDKEKIRYFNVTDPASSPEADGRVK